jgi:Fe-S cluster assembly protein SufB
MSTETLTEIGIDRSVGDFSYPEKHEFDAGYGLTADTVRYISGVKSGPDWIRDFRLRALDVFEDRPMPTHWASEDLNAIHFEKIRYYLANGQRPTRSWEDVPEDVKRTFERLGIPEQERKFLAGVEAQFDSEAVEYQEGGRRSGRDLRRLDGWADQAPGDFP